MGGPAQAASSRRRSPGFQPGSTDATLSPRCPAVNRQSCLNEPKVRFREGPGGLAVPVTSMGSWALKTPSGPQTGQSTGGFLLVLLLHVCSPNEGDGHPQICLGCTQLLTAPWASGRSDKEGPVPVETEARSTMPKLGSVGFLRPPPQCPMFPHGPPALPRLPPATGADPEAQDQLPAPPLSRLNARPNHATAPTPVGPKP